ncbi:MAG: DNA mismatch repair endonuclease MutL [Clostridia bacterium]|jgi:DNA mismatch repair protein MutL|nr:DNA mismatch repair endonuclease MutL [Clostridia bacterium]
MGLIHILDTEVSNKIAAGEVVERPLSIVKELVENSIDAGATAITVEIRNGGVEYIRVTDNGSGMSEEDAKICFLRHATSKISTGSDLDAIFTLGFRGEALSSIGAVSKVQLYSKRREDSDGVCVTCEGGEILSSSVSGVPDGTVVEVRDLFYNTPARRKFLKKPATEGGYISDIVSRYVFAYPEISFKLIRDGKEMIFSAGDNNLINAVYAIYGKDYAKNVLKVDYEYNGVHITGVIGKGTLCRPNRNYETFLVNKRYIKSAMMMRALDEAYKNQIMISKFPVAVLNIEISPEEVDINVHPTKLECKFSNEQDIYQAVYHGAKSALYALPNVPNIERGEETAQIQKPEQKSIEDIFKEKLKEAERLKERPNPVAKRTDIDIPKAAKEQKPKIDALSMIDFAIEHSKQQHNPIEVKSPTASENKIVEEESWRDYLKRESEKIEIDQNETVEENKNFFVGGFRVIGQLFETYILVEKDDSLLMIDQHAAHERLNYEALKAELEETGIASQMMLETIDVKLAPSEIAVFEANKELFRKLGFESNLNGDTVEISAVPGDISWSDTEPLFLELLSQMDDMKQELISDKKQRLIYTISCKASIKANMKIGELEMQRLVEKVFSLNNINTCPHGRPIVISMSKKEIEKDFKRIV